MSTTLRVSEHTRAHAASLAAASGRSIGHVVEQALVEYERAEFWRQTAAALAQHNGADADDADDEQAWDRATRDGLDHD